MTSVAIGLVFVGIALLGVDRDRVAATQTGEEKIAVSCRASAGAPSDICLVNPDGSGVERLTDTAESEGNPAVSPDGTRIAWSVNPTFDLWVLDLATDEVVRIFAGTPDFVLGDSPSWAPDGTRVAFKCNPTEICVVGSDGSGLASLLRLDFPNQVGELDWSPDGSAIVFECSQRLCLAEADGSAWSQLPGQNGDSAPAWSPDGRTIAFIGMVNIFQQGLLAMDADGENRRPVYSATAVFDPAWSPDGARLAATCLPVTGETLCLIDATTGAATNVASGGQIWGDYDWAYVGGPPPPPPDPAATIGRSLAAGGNLVGWTGGTAVEVATGSISGDFDVLFTFDAASQTFRSFRPGVPAALNSLQELTLGQGVWVNVTAPAGAVWELPVHDAAREVTLAAEFNLVVWTGPDGAVVGEAVDQLGTALEALFVWDEAAGVFRSYRPEGPGFLNDAATIDYGDGIWMKMRTAATWTQPASGLAP